MVGKQQSLFLIDLSVGDGGCIVHPHLPIEAARCEVGWIPGADLELLEGKMMHGTPARPDKRCEVGQTTTQQERRD